MSTPDQLELDWGRGSITDPPADAVGLSLKNNPRRENLREQAAKWIEETPEAYRMFERFALEAFHAGQRFGAKALAERVRWECEILGRGEFKINNNYTAYVARKLVLDHPELASMLRFRETRY